MPYALLFPVILLGQPSSSTITVTASRDASSQPDQVLFGVIVESRAMQGLNEVLRALTPAGLTQADLSGVFLRTTGPPSSQTTALNWNFDLRAPIARLREVTTSLTALAQTMNRSNSGLFMSFSLGGSTAQQRLNCDPAALIADARTQAQEIASAATLNSGPLVGIRSDVTDGAPGCSMTATFAALPASATVGENLIRITASRTNRPQFDQVNLALTLTSGMNAGFEEVTEALGRAGVSGITFTGVRPALNAAQPRTQAWAWSFQLSTPLTSLTGSIAQLASARSRIGLGFRLDFDIQGLEVSSQAQPVCRWMDLLADAKTHAQRLGTAAGVTVGQIVSMSKTDIDLPTQVSRVIPYSVFVLGGIASRPVSEIVTGLATNRTTPCSLAVQFQLR